ncbi:hypothetical protein BKH41_06925 [Helicobacter sp. 12S02232-10]|uniref:glycosyltransferase family 4 protein n=1 Tax=Helicobacter sp. 12S02232-10 TaxID=1476197 RepID=UPI000BA73A71|nr:glycosyltransferase family 1 protein [Helicobacter sp. 12S02232-10]PAF47624.1 hypothetical protein BKH41_06925 [Helicobacter sp. 12S02232-10]
MKIIFDGYCFKYITQNNSSRSGIFFSAYNILTQMLQYKDLDITIYADVKTFYIFKEQIRQERNLKNVKLLEVYRKSVLFVSYLYYLKSKFIPKGIFQILLSKLTTLILFFLEQLALFMSGIKKINLNQIEIYFSPKNKVPKIFYKEKNITKFILLHDVVPLVLPKHLVKQDRGFIGFLKEKITGQSWFEEFAASLNQDDYYFANSIYTKNDFLKYCPKINPDKIMVTYLGTNENFYPDKNTRKNILIRQKYHIPQDKKYIFSLCSLEPRKNLLFVVENFIDFIKNNQIQDLVFVLGGGYWEEFIKEFEKKIDGLGDWKDKIIRAGYVDDEDLANLYSHSLCSVYLSIYEGFGLPALEAMKCGSPLIASNVTSIPEVVGGGGDTH